ncbi:MAG: hydantoinase/oxoprolinase family protein [Nitrososphaerales archaeon]
MRIAIDIGGTFTDIVAYDEQTGRTSFGKSQTTTGAMVGGVIAAIKKSGVELGNCSNLLHGTTAVINTLVERKGAKTALVTTKGFRDVYEIGRINRPDSYNLFFKKHVPLVPRYLRFEVEERLRGDGTVLVPFSKNSALEVISALKQNKIEALAITFLHSYRNSQHEALMKEIVKESMPEIYISVSSDVTREYREYERTSTTAANAYVGPKISRYIDELEAMLEKQGFTGKLLLMQSNGGLYESNAAKAQPIQLVESGPAGGIAGAAHLSRMLGFENSIGLDMGGTTAKACTIENGVASSGSDYFVGGYNSGLAIRIPVIDITEVGAGGGSIARIDETKSIKVGPDSAGSDPGPACYGKGGVEPTVTDADVIMGKINPTRFLGGEMKLDMREARTAIFGRIAKVVGVSLEDAAAGVVGIADALMAYAVRSVTTEKGLDTRDFVLVSYGGAGPTHVAPVAEELQIPLVIIPRSPAHFSAMGMLYSDLRRDYVQTFFVPVAVADLREIDETYQKMEALGLENIKAPGVELSEISILRSADMRYVGQEHAVLVLIPLKMSSEENREEIKKRFDSAHLLRYAHNAPEEKSEFVSLRVTVLGKVKKPEMQNLAVGSKLPPKEAERGSRKVYFGSNYADSPVYSRETLLSGNIIEGPAVVEEYASNVPVPPGFIIEVEKHGNLFLRLKNRS